MSFAWKNKVFPEIDEPVYAEIRFAERHVGAQMKNWSDTDSVFASFFWAVRRADPQLLSWEELDQMNYPRDFQVIDDKAADADPPAPSPSGEPATATGSSTTSESSTSPD